MDKIIFPNKLFIDGLNNRGVPLRMEFVTSGMQHKTLPKERIPEIAIVGRSNVGKSSLLNYLAGQRQLARVSKMPGRTQTMNYFNIEKGALALIDLPGYGFAQSAKKTKGHWQKAMEELFNERKSLIGIFFLFDIRRQPEEEDVLLFKWLHDLGLKIIMIQTKCDKIHKKQWLQIQKNNMIALDAVNIPFIFCSSQDKFGLKEICSTLSLLLNEAKDSNV